MELSSKGSSGTCIPEVFPHSSTPLSRRTSAKIQVRKRSFMAFCLSRAARVSSWLSTRSSLPSRLDDVIDGRAFQIERLLQQPDAVGTVRAVVRGGGHRPDRLQARLDAPDRIGRQVGDGHRVRGNPKEVGGEGLDIRLRDPGGAQVGVNIAGEHILRLHQAQRFSIAGIGGASALGGRELGAYVAQRDRHPPCARPGCRGPDR